MLDRNCKGVQPTDVGNQVIEKAVEIFSIIDEIRAFSPDYQLEMIHISAIPCICDFLIPECIMRLTKNNLPLKLSVHTDETTEVIRKVASGFSSIGLLIHDSTLNLGTLEYYPLFNDRYVLYVGQASPLYNKQSVTLEEALLEPYIAYREEFQTQNPGLSSLFNDTQKPNIAFRTDELSNIRRMIQYSNYVAFFPEKMSQKDIYLQDGSIRAIPISDFDTNLAVGYVINPKYRIPSIINDFIKSLCENFEAL